MPFNPSDLTRAAEAAPGWDEPPPPDVYEAELTKAETFMSKAGEDWLRLTWKVLTGRLRDHTWSHIQTLERYKADGSDNEVALSITARILTALGINVSPEMNLLAELDHVRGGAYEVEVKRNGSFVNTTPKQKLASVQTELGAGGYGQAPAQSSAIYQGDGPDARERAATEEGRTPPSDVPGPQAGEFVHPPPKKGDIDPETGEPIPF